VPGAPSATLAATKAAFSRVRGSAHSFEFGEPLTTKSRSMSSEALSHIRTIFACANGRFYLGGYDCYLPSSSYEGDPIRCGDSFEGMVDVGIPTMWIYKFTLDGEDLHFEAEMRAQDSTYWYILDGPVVPLSAEVPE
jgi:hypothetical protein